MPWIPLLPLVMQLRKCFPRAITFHFFCLALVGFLVRTDRAGVSGLMRALLLPPQTYHGLLRAFHAKGTSVDRLVEAWTAVVLSAFKSFLTTIDGRIVIVADGLKVPKEGRKMPAVKLLHQESNNNSKPPWVMGHMFQSAGILVTGLRRIFAVPIFSRVHEGLQASNRESRSLVDKLLVALLTLPIAQPAFVVVDSYYSAWTFARLLSEKGHHLISQVRSNAVARRPAETPAGTPRRGRKPKYGEAVKLSDLFSCLAMTTVEMCVYGKEKFKISYWVADLFWPKAGIMVRYVGTRCSKGTRILVSTDLSLSPERIIELYALRMKVEVSFRVAIHNLCAYTYRFWMKSMDRISRYSKGQFIHRKSAAYRARAFAKLASCERYVMCGLIAQGLLQYLAVAHAALIHSAHAGWIRTYPVGRSPTEEMTMNALRNTLPAFLESSRVEGSLMKFLRSFCFKDRQSEQSRARASG